MFHIPSAFQVSADYDRLYDRPGYRVGPELKEQARRVLEPRARLGRWFQANLIRYVDPTMEFKRRDRDVFRLYFGSDGHWSRNEHRVAFELLSEYLVTYRLIPSEYLASPVQIEARVP